MGSHGQMASLGYPTVSDQPKYGFITNKQNIAREGLRKRTSTNHFKKGMYWDASNTYDSYDHQRIRLGGNVENGNRGFLTPKYSGILKCFPSTNSHVRKKIANYMYIICLDMFGIYI